MAAFDIQESLPNNAGIESEVNTSVINETTPEGYVDSSNQSQGLERDPYSDQLIQDFNAQFTPAAIGPQGQAALYPGLKHNINVGTQQGSIIGSQGIYVPGGNIAAVDPVLARRKAIDDAAKQRAAALKPFKYKDPTKLKDARFQEKFNEQYNETANKLIEDAKSKYGKDFSIVLQDQGTKEGREFIQTMANYEFIGREMDQITDLVAEIDTGLEEGTLSYSDETLDIYDDYKNLLGSFEDGDVMKSVDIENMHKKLQGALSIEEQLGKTGFLKNIMGEKSGYAYDTDKGEYYKYGTNTKVTYKEALGQVVESLTTKGGPLAQGIRDGVYTKDDVLKAVNSKFKDQQSQTGSISKKSAGNIADEDVSEDGITYDEAREDNNYTYNEDGTLSTKEAEPGTVTYRHDVNLSGKNNKVTYKKPDGTIQTIAVGGIPLTQATFLNGNKTQNFEETSYSKITGISTITRDGKDYVVANTSTVAPAKISYKKERGKWVEITAEEYKNRTKAEKKETNKYKRQAEYRPVEVPIVLVGADGVETGTFNEIKDALQQKGSKEGFEKAYNAAKEKRGATGAGTAFN